MGRKRVLYGVSNYEEMVRKHGYFVDKTAYIHALENYENPVFLRPRRFGKSLWCSILSNYYDVNKKDRFQELFGHTAIGKNPTASNNACMILHLDFSVVSVTPNLKEVERSFRTHCHASLEVTLHKNRHYFEESISIDPDKAASDNLEKVQKEILKKDLPPLYVIIDEYDNFANQLITSHEAHLYQNLTSDESFFKTFFKTLKSGRQLGAIANTFVTGVLPITMDDLASGYNIGSFITLNPGFGEMLGYTQTEVDQLLDEIYQDYELPVQSRPEVNAVIKDHYNGYLFTEAQAEKLYNSTILMYFLRELCNYKVIPEFLTDENLKTDISWVRRLTSSQPEQTQSLIKKLTVEEELAYDHVYLKEKFSMSQFFQESYFPISFFYLGMLTKKDPFRMHLPNTNMRKIFTEYFNEIHQIDVSTQYASMMEQFSKNPDLPRLFAGYWELYIAQLPEAIFQQVNENFYRTTFYELCSRYLSFLYTWNIERSYPLGKSDLEFVGKYHEAFAGIRYVTEFKYYSNRDVKRQKINIETFQLLSEDHQQIDGYCQGLRQEYPKAKISKFVIYCFGNQGFRVFEV